jgi:hypothetical protein
MALPIDLTKENPVLRKLAVLVIAPVLFLGVAAATQASAAGDAHAASFVAKANAERTSRGLRALVVKSDLTAVAARHSARMASQSKLYHNPSLGSDVSGWQVVGENVGNGGSVDSIHTAFMNSPAHRANILATDYSEIGIATVTDSRGVIWVTQVFRLPMAAAPVVTAPVRQQAARTVVRVPVRRPVVKPVAKPAAAPKRVAPPAPVRPDASRFLSALATENAAAENPFALATAYADTMSALAR